MRVQVASCSAVHPLSLTHSLCSNSACSHNRLDAKVNVTQDAFLDDSDDNNTEELFDSTPKRLRFDLDNNLISKIFHAESALGDEILASDVYALEFGSYGKSFIIKHKMSPDSFVQMSIIMAYYKLYGEVVCAYEPVLTKRFLHGRTEAMRSLTSNAVKFCKTWSSKFSTVTDKIIALQEAVVEHSRQVKKCSNGLGIDRHLYSLKCIGELNGVESNFFADGGWKALNHTVLSTSNCGNPSLRLFGFGPVVPDGFGIGYIIRETGLQYTISSKHRQTKRFANVLESFLQEFKKLAGGNRKVSVAQHRSTVIRSTSTVKSPTKGQAAGTGGGGAESRGVPPESWGVGFAGVGARAWCRRCPPAREQGWRAWAARRE